MRLGRSSSARSARAPCAALFDFFLRQTNAPRARQPGGAGQTAAGSAGEGLILSPGLRREGVPAGVAGATKNKLRRRRMGVISPPRFFSPLFSSLFPSRGQDARRARRDALFVSIRVHSCPFVSRMPAARGGMQPPQQAPRRREADLDDCRLAVVMLSRPGRQNKTEGLQYLEPKGNVLFCSPGELLPLRRQPRAGSYSCRASRFDPSHPIRYSQKTSGTQALAGIGRFRSSRQLLGVAA